MTHATGLRDTAASAIEQMRARGFQQAQATAAAARQDEVNIALSEPSLLRSTDAQRLPYLLRLDATAAGALQPNWRRTSGMTAAKHRGYAVTWFSLSTVLVLLFFWWLYKTRSSQHD